MWISIKNDGPELVKTNFWDTESGNRNYAYAMNAGCPVVKCHCSDCKQSGYRNNTASLFALSRQAYQSRISPLKTPPSNSETTRWSI
jgi:hypothetical protein